MYKKPDARQSICFVHKTYCVLDVPVAVAVVVLKGPFFNKKTHYSTQGPNRSFLLIPAT